MSALISVSVEATHFYVGMSSDTWPNGWSGRKTRVLQTEKGYERYDAVLRPVMSELISSSILIPWRVMTDGGKPNSSPSIHNDFALAECVSYCK